MTETAKTDKQEVAQNGAQEQEIHFVITKSHLEEVFRLLVEIPWKQSNPVITLLEKSVKQVTLTAKKKPETENGTATQEKLEEADTKA